MNTFENFASTAIEIAKQRASIDSHLAHSSNKTLPPPQENSNRNSKKNQTKPYTEYPEQRNGILGRELSLEISEIDARNAPKSPIDCRSWPRWKCVRALRLRLGLWPRVSTLCFRLFVLNGLSVRAVFLQLAHLVIRQQQQQQQLNCTRRYKCIYSLCRCRYASWERTSGLIVEASAGRALYRPLSLSLLISFSVVFCLRYFEDLSFCDHVKPSAHFPNSIAYHILLRKIESSRLAK